jgi:urate oxidase
VTGVFKSFESGSIQQIIHQMGTKIFADIPEITELRFEATNRTWDVVEERGEEYGVYIDAAAPYGILGLTLTR